MEYNNAWGLMVGAPGRGVRTIVEMVVHTRLDCTIGSAALMRVAAQQAAHHAATRRAFGTTLADAPLMRAVLSDLALESEAAIATWQRLGRAFDAAATGGDESEIAFRRLATAIGKYWVCKRAPSAVYEAMECFGGNGYVEDGPMARLYRQAPLNAIWEGSGNVICLDVLRSMRVEPSSVRAFLDELGRARGADRRYDAFLTELTHELTMPDPASAERRARLLVDRMAVALQAAAQHPSQMPEEGWRWGSGGVGEWGSAGVQECTGVRECGVVGGAGHLRAC